MQVDLPTVPSPPVTHYGARNRRKILCFVPHLGGGGAEMHLLRLLNHFDRTEFQPVLAVARAGGSYESRLSDDVAIHKCSWGSLPSATLRMLTAIAGLRRAVRREQPDVIMSFLDHSVGATRRAIANESNSRPLFIAGIQNNLEKTFQHLPLWTWRWLRREILAGYTDADHVIALSCGVADALTKSVPAIRRRVTVIYNAGYDQEVLALARKEPSLSPPKRPWFLACGRLTAQKDFATLLRAFARVKDDIDAELWILGEGELRARLERNIVSLGLTGRVRLPGFVENPFAFMARATTFVLSSRWEGFGNVVTEALACGAPVIATDCPHGPREILEDGKWGELVPVGDVQTLAATMRSSLRDKARFDVRAAKARAYVTRFETARITEQYQTLIHSALANRRSATYA